MLRISTIEDSPVKASAISLWLEGADLKLCIPSQEGQMTHTLSIPLSRCSLEQSDSGTTLPRQRGWESLLSILHEREQSLRQPTIAEKGAPVQYDLEKMLRGMQAKIIPARKKREATEELSLEDLEI